MLQYQYLHSDFVQHLLHKNQTKPNMQSVYYESYEDLARNHGSKKL